ncbi:MAG: hypothetical protein FWG98_15620 [Candidatus Cloacimonetes bacterium]|nr:hypothetical protein [Candidatus Cloacimonadota bacterium]
MLVPPDNYHTEKSCYHCKHIEYTYETEYGEMDDYPNCIAFPDGIPRIIYHNGHYVPRPDLGQKNEIVFEPDFKTIKRSRDYQKHHKAELAKMKKKAKNANA